MKIYYKEFEDLTELNECVDILADVGNIISLNYTNEKHCMYYYM